MYPLDKYKYYTNGKKVIAVSTYAGKTVRGVACCDPKDTFDLEKGKQLAALRCAAKIADKRVQRAGRKLREAVEAASFAWEHQDKMESYYGGAQNQWVAIHSALRNFENSLKNN